MRIKIILLSLISIFGMHCYSQTYEEQVTLVKNFLKLDQEKFIALHKNDTVIYEICKSIKVKDTTRLRRRVDSLLSKNYSLSDFMVILEIDRMYRDKTLELDRRRKKNRIKLDSIDEIESHIEDNKRRLKEQLKFKVKTKN